jgi:hypothetical protein
MEFSEEEKQHLLALLNTPVNIAPSQMTKYLQLVQSIMNKLNGNETEQNDKK